jgi:hypothetical protein
MDLTYGCQVTYAQLHGATPCDPAKPLSYGGLRVYGGHETEPTES